MISPDDFGSDGLGSSPMAPADPADPADLPELPLSVLLDQADSAAAWDGPLLTVMHGDDPEDGSSVESIPAWTVLDGVPAVLVGVEDAGAAWDHAADRAQTRLDELEQQFRRAEAGRVRGMVAAYSASMGDLRQRFGAEFATRQSMGAQAFFKQTGLALGLHPTRVAHLVDTATLVKARLPRTWGVFEAAGCTWRALETAVQQAEGLDADRRWSRSIRR